MFKVVSYVFKGVIAGVLVSILWSSMVLLIFNSTLNLPLNRILLDPLPLSSILGAASGLSFIFKQGSKSAGKFCIVCGVLFGALVLIALLQISAVRPSVAIANLPLGGWSVWLVFRGWQ